MIERLRIIDFKKLKIAWLRWSVTDILKSVQSVMNAIFIKNNNIHEVDIYVEKICNVHKSSRASNIIKIITVVSL